MTNEIHSRAAKGGQIGANGEWYVGGQFIATTDHAKGHKIVKKATGRVQVARGEWVQSRDGFLPIFGIIGWNDAVSTSAKAMHSAGKRWVKSAGAGYGSADWSCVE